MHGACVSVQTARSLTAMSVNFFNGSFLPSVQILDALLSVEFSDLCLAGVTLSTRDAASGLGSSTGKPMSRIRWHIPCKRVSHLWTGAKRC